MQFHYRLGKRSLYPWLFLILAAIANVALLISLPAPKSIELSIPTTGVVAGFVYFLYSQHLQETRLFTDLFRQFNERYDALNEALNEITSRGNQILLSQKDKQVLYDYFNLCAEEYLYFKTGYIDQEVWNSWLRGMQYFLSSPDIKRLWDEELKGGSYYGFSLRIIENGP